MNIINQYSYVFFSLFVFGATIFGLRRLHQNWLVTSAASVVVAVMMVSGFFVLRPGESDVNSAAAAEAIINNGKPTFVEFYSNYCAGCITVRPLVDTIVSDLRETYPDSYNVLRVDIHTDFGRTLREAYGFSFTPEFVLFDRRGEEVWRSHLPPSGDDLERALATEDLADSNAVP